MFVIDGLEDTICYPENTVEIYNRWGVLVFETRIIIMKRMHLTGIQMEERQSVGHLDCQQEPILYFKYTPLI
jgi:hypothetical protein